MTSQAERDKPLVLGLKSEFHMVGKAIEPELGEDHPLMTRFRAAIDELGWEGSKLTIVLRGEEKDIVMRALHMYVVIPPENLGEEWHQAQAAAILGVDLKAMGVVAPDCEATVSAPVAVPNLIA